MSCRDLLILGVAIAALLTSWATRSAEAVPLPVPRPNNTKLSDPDADPFVCGKKPPFVFVIRSGDNRTLYLIGVGAREIKPTPIPKRLWRIAKQSMKPGVIPTPIYKGRLCAFAD